MNRYHSHVCMLSVRLEPRDGKLGQVCSLYYVKCKGNKSELRDKTGSVSVRCPAAMSMLQCSLVSLRTAQEIGMQCWHCFWKPQICYICTLLINISTIYTILPSDNMRWHLWSEREWRTMVTWQLEELAAGQWLHFLTSLSVKPLDIIAEGLRGLNISKRDTTG